MNPTFIQQDPSIARRRKLVDAMTMREKSGPIRTGMEGAGRLAMTLANTFGRYKADKEQKEYDTGAQEDLARIMSDYSQDVRPLSQHPGTSNIATQIQMQQIAGDKAAESAAAGRVQGLDDYEAKKLIDQKYGPADRLPNEALEFNFFNQLSPEMQQLYLKRKRAGAIKDFGSYHGSVDPISGGVTNIGAKEVPPQSTAAHKLAIIEATERGKKLATIGGDIDSGNEFVDLIQKAIDHPGREAATGKSGIFNSVAIPGSDRKNFLVLADQLKGKNFLAAFQSLKGGGPITDVEGKKAEESQARLNTAQSDEEYLSALDEMKGLIAARVQKAMTFRDVDSGGSSDDGGWGIVK